VHRLPPPTYVSIAAAVCTVAAILLVTLGVRTLLTRRLPHLTTRFGSPTAAARTQPIRMGGFWVLLGASVVLMSAPWVLVSRVPDQFVLWSIVAAFPTLIAAGVWTAVWRR
jgi:hypothetical protein